MIDQAFLKRVFNQICFLYLKSVQFTHQIWPIQEKVSNNYGFITEVAIKQSTSFTIYCKDERWVIKVDGTISCSKVWVALTGACNTMWKVIHKIFSLKSETNVQRIKPIKLILFS